MCAAGSDRSGRVAGGLSTQVSGLKKARQLPIQSSATRAVEGEQKGSKGLRNGSGSRLDQVVKGVSVTPAQGRRPKGNLCTLRGQFSVLARISSLLHRHLQQQEIAGPW